MRKVKTLAILNGKYVLKFEKYFNMTSNFIETSTIAVNKIEKNENTAVICYISGILCSFSYANALDNVEQNNQYKLLYCALIIFNFYLN